MHSVSAGAIMSTIGRTRREVERLLREAGAVVVDKGHGGKHPWIKFLHNGREHRINYPSSSGDRNRGMVLLRAEIQRKTRITKEVE
jgi:hypothetical protein